MVSKLIVLRMQEIRQIFTLPARYLVRNVLLFFLHVEIIKVCIALFLLKLELWFRTYIT